MPIGYVLVGVISQIIGSMLLSMITTRIGVPTLGGLLLGNISVGVVAFLRLHNAERVS